MRRDLPVTSPTRRIAGSVTPLPLKLTGRKAKFVANYLMSANGPESAIAAGYSPNNPRGQAYRLLRCDAAVIAAIKEGQARVCEAAEVTAESMMKQLSEDRQFAMSSGNAMAAVRASEIQAKLGGLLIDRADVRGVHALRVEVVRFGEGGGGDGTS